MRKLPLLLALFIGLYAPASEPILKNGDFKADLHGTTIAYTVAGKGPVCMVLTNSWGFTGNGLRKLFGALEDQLTMVYFDPRGMGQSAPVVLDSDLGMETVRRDMNALRNHLGLEKTHFLGWSNGAMNGLLYVAEYNQHVNRAAFLHGIADLKPHPDQKNGPQEQAFRTLLSQFIQQMRQDQGSDDTKNEKLRHFILDEWFPELFANKQNGKATMRQLFNQQQFSHRHMMHQFLKDMQGYDATPGFAKIKSPCLVIAGSHDAMPAAKVKEIQEGIKAAKFEEFTKSGHFSSLEEPERFHQVMVQFFKGE